VYCFDHIGCGARIEEVEGFYERYPRWSLLGKMVGDGQAALEALQSLPYVDPQQVWGLGYSLGSLAGLHLAALDDRLAGFVSVCGPPPFRSDTPSAATGGIRRWSHTTMVLPRLGDFVGHEDSVPYDVHLLFACLAPRPLLVISPQLDREAAVPDVSKAVAHARSVYALYGASERLEQQAPEDYNHFGPAIQGLVVDWLHRHVRQRGA
jgi:pimeloyl-ACP methyl ester carboxylesterase